MEFAPFVVILMAMFYFVYRRVVSPRPQHPPLETSPDDPLLVEAMAKARASLDRFMTLVRRPHDGALVKVRFVSSSEQVEHLWAEVVEVVSDDELRVRLVTPPVTHSGRLERLRMCTVDEIEDWHVRDRDGRLHGGYTQRAMYAIARRDGVELPRRLRDEERLYVDGGT